MANKDILQSKAQVDFNKAYIDSGEIARVLGVGRASIKAARDNGKLPNAIQIGYGANIYLWERAKVAKIIDAWGVMLNERRYRLSTKKSAGDGLTKDA